MKPQTYLRTLINSISSPRYYLDILNAPLQFSLRFFVISYLLIAALQSGLFYFVTLPTLRQNLHQAITEFSDHFPQDLEVKWTGEKIETTTTSPVAVHYPSFFPTENMPKTFGFFLPELHSADDISKSLPTSAWWVVNKETAFISDGTGDWSSLPLKDTPGFEEPFTMNKNTLPAFTSAWQELGEALLSLSVILFPLGWFFFVGAGRMIALAIDAALTYFVIRSFNRYFHFTKIFQIGLHILVVAELVQFFFPLFIPNYNAPIFLITFWAYLIFILTTLWNVKKVEVKPPTAQE